METMSPAATESLSAIDTEDLVELPYFENFLKRIGFKRIDGSIYGLLVMSSRPLTSEEIEKALGLSQSAVSLSLKTLSHYGAVETEDHPENKRVKLHRAKDDSLSIVANVFRKREGQYIEEFKFMAKRLMEKLQKQNEKRPLSDDDKANLKKKERRLRSIIVTCESSEVVMNFVINLTRSHHPKQYENVLARLPNVLRPLLSGAEAWGEVTSLKSTFGQTLKRFKQTLGNS